MGIHIGLSEQLVKIVVTMKLKALSVPLYQAASYIQFMRMHHPYIFGTPLSSVKGRDEIQAQNIPSTLKDQLGARSKSSSYLHVQSRPLGPITYDHHTDRMAISTEAP